MSFNIIEASNKITSQYQQYLKTIFDIQDLEYRNIFKQRLLECNSFAKGPYLEVVDSFKKGRSVKELISSNVISNDFSKIKKIYNIPSLYKHQEESLLKAIDGKNLIVTTGTGSGKTECFLLPILNELMREKENGSLNPGVRALIIYPMNALANDQVDRLRKILIDYPDITFGCYTGQTKKKDNSTKNDNGFNENRKDSIPNERLTREAMKESPPHILITNYAMLEYLLLRPEDNVFFDGEFSKKWKYIVLDEAHTYTGSSGAEVSRLLKRVLARINQKVQFILTSATLGNEEKNEDIVNFAKDLCSSFFDNDSIIRPERVSYDYSDLPYDLGIGFYIFVNKLILANDEEIIKKIKEQYNLKEFSDTIESFLFDVLSKDKTFASVKYFLNEPKSIEQIKEKTGWKEDEISSFIDVGSKAIKNDCRLLDARYHTFLKATDGAFITLYPHKDLFLERKDVVFSDDVPYKVFEIATCKQCHGIYLLGYIKGDYLKQETSIDSDNIKYAFYLGDKAYSGYDEDTYEKEPEKEFEKRKFKICPHCGFIKKDGKEKTCGHDESQFLTVINAKKNNEDNKSVCKCVQCESVSPLGILRGFLTGQDAATSVLGTSLFEELPDTIVKKEKKQSFGFDDDIDDKYVINSARQFMTFSDNRQSASYFSSYFSRSYEGLLCGRIINKILNNIDSEEIILDDFVRLVEKEIEKRKIDLSSLTDVETSSKNRQAWLMVMKELCDSNSRTSLSSLGLLKIGISNNINFKSYSRFGLSSDDIRSIYSVFVDMMIKDGAIDFPNCINDQCSIEKISYGTIQKKYSERSKEKDVVSFVPNSSNKRLDYLIKIIQKSGRKISNEEAIEVLSNFWKYITQNDNILKCFGNVKTKYVLNRESIVLYSPRSVRWYRCNKCHKVTPYNVKNACSTFKCDGELSEIDIKILKENHYYQKYNEMEITPIRIKEHTAQLNSDKAKEYQQQFINKEIDVLSCSTTFELGVDVGDLETVFLRNMPPSPANYAQRAGRAGRSLKSAAFALTYCNKSNHDFNYFDEPLNMIKGVVNPPHFKVDNEKICIRHLYSAILSFFFNKYPFFFENEKFKVSNFMESNSMDISGYDLLKRFLSQDSDERKKLQDYLKEVIPSSLHNKFMIDSFGFKDFLFTDNYPDYPSLYLAKNKYEEAIKVLKEKYKDDDKRIRTYRCEDLISYFARNNILPRYGFAVDTVELKTYIDNNSNESASGLKLSRDLAMAISEYAPDCQIVADDNLFTSRYIKKDENYSWKIFDYGECGKCKTLNVKIHIGDPLCKCSQCHEKINAKQFLIPQFGFIAEKEYKKPSLIKPEKTFRTEVSYFSDDKKNIETKYQIGNTEFIIEMIGNDGQMAILNNSDFKVCPICGFATLGEFKNHNNSKGYPCNQKLSSTYSLGYTFKTDVIKIKINKSLNSENMEERHDEAYSILQSLVLASSKILGIDENEIQGCLQYYCDSEPNYSYILYDKTPGGAGYVRKLNNEKNIFNIIQMALNIAKNCHCDENSSCYSCLRTYQNQRHHDQIKRSYVIKYLEPIIDAQKSNKTESGLEDAFLDALKEASSSWNVSSENHEIFEAKFQNQKWKIEPQVRLDETKGYAIASRPDFLLTPIDKKQKPIAIFTDGFKFHYDKIKEDSLKRDAIILSKKCRVFSLCWDDIFNKDKENGADYFDGINVNQFELLIKYLENEDSELIFSNFANEYINKIRNELQVELTNKDKEIIDKLGAKDIIKYSPSSGSLFFSYLSNDGLSVSSLFDDTYTNKSKDFKKDWQCYIIYNNIMQFVDNFVLYSLAGINSNQYKKVLYEQTSLDSWNNLLVHTKDEIAKKIILEASKNGNINPPKVGVEFDDAEAELYFEDLNLVYLTALQKEYTKIFEKKNIKVITTLDEFKKGKK